MMSSQFRGCRCGLVGVACSASWAKNRMYDMMSLKRDPKNSNNILNTADYIKRSDSFRDFIQLVMNNN